MSSGIVEELFGERDETFTLGIGTGEELEEVRAEALRKQGFDAGQASLMAIFTRLSTGTWLIGDLRSTLRYGLIGGGMDRDAATRLVQRELRPGNVARCAILAAAVLRAFIIGEAEDQDSSAKKAPARRAARTRRAVKTDASDGAGSTDRAPSSD